MLGLRGERHRELFGVVEMLCILIGWWLHRVYICQNSWMDEIFKMDDRGTFDCYVIIF